MQIESGHVRRQRTYYELKQVEGLKVDICIVIFEKLAEKNLHRLDQISRSSRRDRGHPFLDYFLNLHYCLQSLL